MTIFLPDDPSEVCLVLVVIVEPLGVHDVVHRRHPLPLVLDARAHAPQLLHLPAATQHQTKVHAQCPIVEWSISQIWWTWGLISIHFVYVFIRKQS